MDMSLQALRAICTERKLYRTPHLNDKLYAHFKGFRNLRGLEEYVNLKALFLEGNALEDLADLPPLKELRCLYVQQNCITHISGLDNVPLLATLNISSNRLKKLENLSCCPGLSTLIATGNLLTNLESVEHLAECKSLQTLDLQDNRIDDPAILDVVTQIPELKCLYLKGNPVVSKIRSYRKTLISRIPTLVYLDDRPVFELERKCAEAWAVGGLDAENEARAKHKAEEQERDRRNFEYMQAIRREGWKKRRERMGKPGDGDPDLDDLSDTEWEFNDPPELVEARSRLAAYAAAPGEEEPPELSEARRDLVHARREIQPASAPAAPAEEGYKLYLQSIKQNQAALEADAREAAATQQADTQQQDQEEDSQPSASAPGGTSTADQSAVCGSQPAAAEAVAVQAGAETTALKITPVICTSIQPAAPEQAALAEAVVEVTAGQVPVAAADMVQAVQAVQASPVSFPVAGKAGRPPAVEEEPEEQNPLCISSIELNELD